MKHHEHPNHHEHLFQPGHAATARRILARGWPAGYLAVCVVCGAPVDLVGALRSSRDAPRTGPSSPYGDGGRSDGSGAQRRVE